MSDRILLHSYTPSESQRLSAHPMRPLNTVLSLDVRTGAAEAVAHSSAVEIRRSRSEEARLGKYHYTIAPTTGIIHNDKTYIGYSDGSVDVITKTERTQHHRFDGPPSRVLSNEGWDRVSLGQQLQASWAFAVHEGRVYDTNGQGVFTTESDRHVAQWAAYDTQSFNGKLCTVPWGRGMEADCSRPNSASDGLVRRYCNSGDLYAIDLNKPDAPIPEGEPVLRRVAPRDGSGMALGRFALAVDRVYMHHGNWPAERITVRDTSTAEPVRVIGIPTARRLIATATDGYFIWDHHNETKLVNADTGTDVFLPTAGEVLTDVRETPDASGLLLILANEKGSRVVHLSEPDKPLYVGEHLQFVHPSCR